MPNLKAMKIYLNFFCPSFIVLAFTFMLLINFELIFTYGMKHGPTSFFCMWISSCHSTICWRGYPLFIQWSWNHGQKAVHTRVNLFMGSQFYSIGLFVSMPVPHCSNYCRFVASFESEKCESSNVVPPVKDYFAYLRLLEIS